MVLRDQQVERYVSIRVCKSLIAEKEVSDISSRELDYFKSVPIEEGEGGIIMGLNSIIDRARENRCTNYSLTFDCESLSSHLDLEEIGNLEKLFEINWNS